VTLHPLFELHVPFRQHPSELARISTIIAPVAPCRAVIIYRSPDLTVIASTEGAPYRTSLAARSITCPLWVNRCVETQPPSRRLSVVAPGATKNGASRRMTRCARSSHWRSGIANSRANFLAPRYTLPLVRRRHCLAARIDLNQCLHQTFVVGGFQNSNEMKGEFQWLRR
jgi:hypothetical protein